MLRLTIAVLALVAVSSAHLCLLNPVQRGGIPASGIPAGSVTSYPECQFTTAPCGNYPDAGAVPAGNNYDAGQSVNVEFIKNDHAVSSSSNYGQFTFNYGLANTEADDYLNLLSVSDENYSGNGPHTMTVEMPTGGCDDCVFQMIFDTPPGVTAGPYYQCADVSIVGEDMENNWKEEKDTASTVATVGLATAAVVAAAALF